MRQRSSEEGRGNESEESPIGAGYLVIRENTAAHAQIPHAVTGVALQPLSLSLFLTCTLT